MDTDDADWAFIAYALSDAASGIADRWAESAERAGTGKRAARHGKLVDRLTRDLSALAAALGPTGGALPSKKADVALADAVAGPLAALGEDLRVAFRDPDGGREPAYDD